MAVQALTPEGNRDFRAHAEELLARLRELSHKIEERSRRLTGPDSPGDQIHRCADMAYDADKQ